MMNVISLGLGVQSTALHIMSSRGELPRADYSIFADPGREKKKTYDYLEWLKGWNEKNNGVPIITIAEKNLYSDLLNNTNSDGQRFASIPAYTMGSDGKEGMLIRQCTAEYKIYMVDKAIRQILGVPRIRRSVNVWKGITTDEWDRMSNTRQKWKVHVYPFTGYWMGKGNTFGQWPHGSAFTRSGLVSWYLQNNLPIPPKSSCVFCPYQSDAALASMKREDPEDFAAAVAVDEAIRHSSKKGINNPVFLHRSLAPLSEIDFTGNQLDLWNGECSGYCHT